MRDVTSSEEAAATMLSMARAYLGEPEGRSPAFLVNRARKQKHRLAVTLFTMFERAGQRLTDGARAEIQRQAERRECYADIVQVVSAVTESRVLKGPSIASRYPSGVVRFTGDLDVAVADVTGFWAAAVLLERMLPEAVIAMTIHDDLSVPNASFAWPAPDPFLDIDLHVDLMLTPFVGDGMEVPLRSLPTAIHDDLLSLTLLAEEMLQRGPSLADALDLSCLLQVIDPTGALATIDELRLAPEASILLADAGRVVPAARDLAANAELEQMVAVERARRATQTCAKGRGTTRHLRRLNSSQRGPFSIVDEIDDALVLETPLGRFLAVTSERISASVWRRASSSHGGTAGTATSKEVQGR